MAWISLVLGAMGVASGMLQALLLLGVPADGLLPQLLGPMGAEVVLPPMLLWVFEHLQLLNFLSLLSSALVTWLSWGLLQRREWGRLGFIAVLGGGALLGLVAAALFGKLLAASGTGTLADADPLVRSLLSAMQAVMWGGALMVAVLHGAIIWKLCTLAIRKEFRST